LSTGSSFASRAVFSDLFVTTFLPTVQRVVVVLNVTWSFLTLRGRLAGRYAAHIAAQPCNAREGAFPGRNPDIDFLAAL